MKDIARIFFSFRFTGILLVVFALAIAAATFIENDFGTATARALIYNARWFEFLLALTALNLSGNILLYKLYRKEKWTILMFHVAFIIILIGAAITRFTGFTGMMHIREGNRSDVVLSDNTYLQVRALAGPETHSFRKKVYLGASGAGVGKFRFRIDGIPYSLEYYDHIHMARPVLQADPGGEPGVSLVITGPQGRRDLVLMHKQRIRHGPLSISLNDPRGRADLQLMTEGNQVRFVSAVPGRLRTMAGEGSETLQAGKEYPMMPMSIYSFGSRQLVLTRALENASMIAVSTQGKEEESSQTALAMLLEGTELSKKITLWGGAGINGRPVQINHRDHRLLLSFGSILHPLPFSLELRDFIIEKYPGSNSPSSFESAVVLHDPEKDLNEERRIFMNNILKHRGYRFYQSAYDPDEKGTILSVNRDAAGTLVTYAGYALLFAGLLLSLFNKNSRFSSLSGMIRAEDLKFKKQVLLVLFLLLPFAIQAQDFNKVSPRAPAREHAREFGTLMVQDYQGRVKPMNSFSSEVLRKVSRKNQLGGYDPDQVVLGMMTDPMGWQAVPMIKVGHDGIREILGIQGDYASFMDLVDLYDLSTYKLAEPVNAAYRKKPAERSKFDTEVIRMDERVNISYMVYSKSIFRILPHPGDENNTWYTPSAAPRHFTAEDSLFAAHIPGLYFQTVWEGMRTNDYDSASVVLNYLKTYQNRFGSDVMPPEQKVRMEIFYNKANIFQRLGYLYFIAGFFLLIVLFIKILSKKFRERIFTVPLSIVIILGIMAHTAGLAMRWYVSGHAPWSNGYESLVYISWATMIAGLIFYRKANISLAVTAILAYMMLNIAHLSWMDPEMTNLVPVLKSYWLAIHVAVIASSYGFLGMAALLSCTALILMIFMNRKNRVRLWSVIKQMTWISEMTIIIGLGLLTIGTFLGGIWANESWGRYWAWDPKETWALVTILVYAFIVHTRFIPGLRSIFSFNLAAVLAYGSVIMTYFGVNYYLSGLHSYAAGDPLPVPNTVYYVVGIILVTAVSAYIRKQQLRSELQ